MALARSKRGAEQQPIRYIEGNTVPPADNSASWDTRNSELVISRLWALRNVVIHRTTCKEGCGTVIASCAHSAGGNQQVCSVTKLRNDLMWDEACKAH